jgi:DNA-binding NtrC family response regulator
MSETDTQNRKKILVVEDDDTCYFLAKEIITELDMIPVRAKNRAEALMHLCMPDNIDLVVMDVFLHDSDNGYIIAKTMMNRHMKVPILIVSAYANALAKLYQRNLRNIKGVLDKPFNIDSFKAELTRILEKNCV